MNSKQSGAWNLNLRALKHGSEMFHWCTISNTDWHNRFTKGNTMRRCWKQSICLILGKQFLFHFVSKWGQGRTLHTLKFYFERQPRKSFNIWPTWINSTFLLRIQRQIQDVCRVKIGKNAPMKWLHSLSRTLGRFISVHFISNYLIDPA